MPSLALADLLRTRLGSKRLGGGEGEREGGVKASWARIRSQGGARACLKESVRPSAHSPSPLQQRSSLCLLRCSEYARSSVYRSQWGRTGSSAGSEAPPVNEQRRGETRQRAVETPWAHDHRARWMAGIHRIQGQHFWWVWWCRLDGEDLCKRERGRSVSEQFYSTTAQRKDRQKTNSAVGESLWKPSVKIRRTPSNVNLRSCRPLPNSTPEGLEFGGPSPNSLREEGQEEPGLQMWSGEGEKGAESGQENSHDGDELG